MSVWSDSYSARSRTVTPDDHRTPAAPKLDQARYAQGVICPKRHVHVDTEGRCEIARRGQALSEQHKSVGDPAPHLGGDLFRERSTRFRIDPIQHVVAKCEQYVQVTVVTTIQSCHGDTVSAVSTRVASWRPPEGASRVRR
jgi:hypothetical protein